VKQHDKKKQVNLSGFFTKSSNPEERYFIPKDEVIAVVSEGADKTAEAVKIVDDKLIEEVSEKSVPILGDDSELESFMFGDVAEAIQLYNSLVSLYVANSFVPPEKKVSKKASKRSAKVAVVDEKVKINDTVLEYGMLFAFC
jgi:hypothetical protein